MSSATSLRPPAGSRRSGAPSCPNAPTRRTTSWCPRTASTTRWRRSRISGATADGRSERRVLEREEIRDGEGLAADEALPVAHADALAVAAGRELDVLAEAVE